MGNRLPKIFAGSRICIICEGNEEYEYLEKLNSGENFFRRLLRKTIRK